MIIVPSALSLITLQNVKEFLQDGVHVPDDDKLTKKRNFSTTIERSFNNSKVKFEVIDSNKAKSLTEPEWSRVVAVFSQGQEWQFRGWLFKTPADIFSRAKGYYVHYDSDLVPQNVRSWNVSFLMINKQMHHLDKTASLKFWEELEPVLFQRHMLKK